MSLANQPGESYIGSLVCLVCPENSFPFFKMSLKNKYKAFPILIILCVEVEVKHRSWLPVVGKLVNRQTLEKLSLSLEISLQCGYEQTLPEPPGAAQKIIFSIGHEFMYERGFVHVQPVLAPYTLEVLHSDRVFQNHICLRHIYICLRGFII